MSKPDGHSIFQVVICVVALWGIAALTLVAAIKFPSSRPGVPILAGFTLSAAVYMTYYAFRFIRG